MTFFRILTMPALAAVAFASLTLPADATPSPVPTTSTSSAHEFLRAHPGGVLLTSNEVAYPDGSGFVAADAGTRTLSECASGRFCMWSSASYTGSFTYVTGTAVTRTLSQSVKSFWNDRSQSARLYNNAGTSSTCYAAGAMKSSLAISYQQPEKVYLSSGTPC